ncbi:MAG TPA: hypothetical protein ENJ02_09815 [Chloroflexi bacterium]|nr:hypothetical protein [Chloroflexota bacterium]
MQRLPETAASQPASPPVGKPAEGSIETIPPRRPRPAAVSGQGSAVSEQQAAAARRTPHVARRTSPPARPAGDSGQGSAVSAQETADSRQPTTDHRPPSSHGQPSPTARPAGDSGQQAAAAPRTPPSIPTEIGPLPADLWELIDEQPAGQETVIQRAASIRQELAPPRGTADDRPQTVDEGRQATDEGRQTTDERPPSTVNGQPSTVSPPPPASADLSVPPTRDSGQRSAASQQTAEAPTGPPSTVHRPPSTPSLDLEALAEKVYEIIRRKLYLEKERLG